MQASRLSFPSTLNDRNEEQGRLPEEKNELDLVEWDGPTDPENPQNWPLYRKVWTTSAFALSTFVVAFGSSVMSAATEVLADTYNVNNTVATLTLTLYVLGFATGPWVWAPASEFYGRYRPLLVGFVGFMCFTVGVACAQNLYTILICRFMQAAWGVSTVTVVPGVLVDLWDQRTRPLMTIAWSTTITLGPSMGPIVGSFTVKNQSLGWRWTMWFTLIMSAFIFILVVATCRETWEPLLLQRKAARMRFETRNWALHARRDKEPVQISSLLIKYGLKPWQMLLMEPILLVVTAYNSVIYGIIYLTFEAYPFAFGTVRGWEPGVASLPFLSLLIGYFTATIIGTALHWHFIDKKLAKNIRPSPEDQLPMMILGGACLTIGLFLFAWTSFPTITWVPQNIAGIFIGSGINLVFIPCVTYLVETYLSSANSALAGNTIVRSAAGAAFPLFAPAMYKNLGVQWATSLIGFISLLFFPAPILFYIYGAKIRSWSKYAFEDKN